MADTRLKGPGRSGCVSRNPRRAQWHRSASRKTLGWANPGRAMRVLCVLLVVATGLAPGTGPGSANAQGRPVVIKLATLAPTDSPWHEIYKEMAARWAQVSQGRVILNIYPGGVAGEEPDVLRKMRIGQLHAGGLTLAGLTHISSAVTALAIPLIMETPEDLTRVRKALEPRLEEILAEKGYVVLNWGDVGWMRFFLPEPDTSPEAVKRHRFVAWSEDRTIELWREAGFRQVYLSLGDVLPGLQTGLANAVSTTPLVVLSNQWFPFLPYMLDLPWAPLVGATLVDKRAWERIPAELRPLLMEVARDAGVRLQSEILRMEAEAIAAMVERGMRVIRPSPEELAMWQEMLREGYSQLRGPIIPEDIFDEALRVAAAGKRR